MSAVQNNDTGSQQKFLLPVSFGVSSTTLLSVLDQHLANRFAKSRMRPYALHVLHVVDDSVTIHADPKSHMDLVKARFPQHTYEIINLSAAILDSDLTGAESKGDNANTAGLMRYLSSAKTPTDAVDLKIQLRTDLITSRAADQSCNAIIWGDSTTRLAEKIMSETAKGRGGLLSGLLSEASKADQGSAAIPSSYPARDLLRKELVMYCELLEPPLTALLVEQPTTVALSARNSTIDDLMTTYFASVEKDYPSIVANVVRTVEKLRVPDSAD